MVTETFSRRFAAELIGTSGLVCAVVGSGIMAERLTGNVAVALLANTIATAAALFALILMFAPISGAHFNPIVSMSSAMSRDIRRVEALFYVCAQLMGGLIGVGLANLMFDVPVFFASNKVRTGPGQWLGELVASFGLVGLIMAISRRYKSTVVAPAVAAYIAAAYWFTSSTSFANPAVAVARSLTDTFTGIRPIDVPLFIVAEVLGAIAAVILFNWLVPRRDLDE